MHKVGEVGYLKDAQHQPREKKNITKRRKGGRGDEEEEEEEVIDYL